MELKKSNLCLSADVTRTSELLELAIEIGNSIVMLKTHADIINDFGESTIHGLREIAHKKRFLLFEDRKFGDIGSTSSSSPDLFVETFHQWLPTDSALTI